MRLMERAHLVDLKLMGIEMFTLEQYCSVHLAVRTHNPSKLCSPEALRIYLALPSYWKSQIRPAASTIPCNSLITLIWQVSL